MTVHRPLLRLAAGRLATALAATTVILAGTLPVVGSNASWREDEWDHATVGTLDCAEDNIFATRAAGKLVGGSMLEADLDDIAELRSMTVTHDGTVAHPDPSGATSAGDAWMNPLDVTAANAVSVPLTGSPLADHLRLDAGAGIGAVNQYARALGNGDSLGASGVVSDSGAVSFSRDEEGSAPTLGTLELSALVEKLTGKAVSSVVAGVSDLSLEVGAVAGRAALDACEAEWTKDLAAYLHRSYAVAALSAELETAVVKDLGVTAGSALDAIQVRADAIDDDNAVDNSEVGDGVRSEIKTGITGLLSDALGGLEIGRIAVTGPSVSLDLAAVRSLATEPISDDAGTVALNPASGQVSVDLAALFGEAYGGEGFGGQPVHGLNALDPNTELVLNTDVTSALVTALEQALDGWVTAVVAAVKTAVSTATTEAAIAVTLRGTVLGLTLDVARLDVTVSGTMSQLLSNTTQTGAKVTVLDDVGNPLLAETIRTLVAPLAPTLQKTAEDGSAPIVGTAVRRVFDAAESPVTQLRPDLTAATAPVVTALAQVLTGYLGAGGAVSLKANVQNDPSTGASRYPDWEGGSQQVRDGQHDVAALSVGVLDVGGTDGDVTLELGRASVGLSCLLGGARHRAGDCTGY